ncbi:hypothetical protein C2E31_10105 [Rhodopirellula baltica]|nr:hypothetical protein C2E31_10105 [Rhodopirellula baltica]
MDAPIVVRVSDEVFSPQSELQTETDVDCCILGVRNRGSADVNGTILINFVPSDENAKLQIRFQGHFVAHTQGNKGPATIHSRSKMAFDLGMVATFDHESGFTPGEPTGTVTPVESDRRISSSMPGLRGRLVHRVASRRMAETKHQVQQICIANARTELIKEMESRVHEQLQSANEKWAKLRSNLDGQPWYGKTPSLRFRSDDGYLVVHVNETDGAKVDADRLADSSELPPPNPNAMTEVLLDRQWVEANEDSGALLAYAASYPRLLSFTFQAATNYNLPHQKQGRWLVFTLKKPSETPVERAFVSAP